MTDEPMFDAELFSACVRRTMTARNLSVRETAKEVGVSSATIGRVHVGKAPDVETFVRLLAWMDKNEPYVQLAVGVEPPCETCKGDVHFCADVPMRHCEKANRQTTT